MKILRLLTAAFTAAFFIASSALAQNAGTVTNHAYAIGKGAGTTGYTSLLCGSAQLAVGQAAADPICRTVTGDVTIDAAGVTAIGTAKVTSAMLRNSGALSVIGRSANSAGVPGDISCSAASNAILRESGSVLGCGSINLASSGAVGTSILPVANGGTNCSAGSGTCLDNISGFAATGLIVRTGAGAYNARTITGPAAGITVTNGSGVSGNPTLALANDLAALEALSGTNNIYYRSAVDTWSSVTIGSGLTFTGGTLAATGGGGSSTPGPPQGRLTLQSGVPVMTTTQSAKTTIFYTPYIGNQVPIYDGASMTMTTFPEISVLTTDTTKNPAAIGASKVNDWFVWNDAGTIRISHGPDWTNDTTRSAGTALTMVNGILLNNALITNGPAAQRGTYVGTTRSNASSQLDHIIGGSASGGTAGFLGVRNYYNRVLTAAKVVDSGVTYTYTSSTIRQARASAGNQITFISFGDDAIDASYVTENSLVNAANGFANSGIGLDTTTAYSSPRSLVYNPVSTANMVLGGATVYRGMPIDIGIGVHFISGNQASDGTNAQVFDNNAKDTLSIVIMN